MSSDFDIKWIVIPDILNAISIVTLGIGGIEFMCPNPLLHERTHGWNYLWQCGDNSFIGYGIAEPFTRHIITWSNGGISYGFWCLILVMIILLYNSILLLVLGKLYKNRKREDVLPNELVFAERYYSNTDK